MLDMVWIFIHTSKASWQFGARDWLMKTFYIFAIKKDIQTDSIGSRQNLGNQYLIDMFYCQGMQQGISSMDIIKALIIEKKLA